MYHESDASFEVNILLFIQMMSTQIKQIALPWMVGRFAREKM